MGWSTKVAIGGVIHGSQVNRHPPHHPPSSYSLVGARLEHFTLIVRMYGFEGEAGREGEGFTRIRESSHRRVCRVCTVRARVMFTYLLLSPVAASLNGRPDSRKTHDPASVLRWSRTRHRESATDGAPLTRSGLELVRTRSSVLG